MPDLDGERTSSGWRAIGSAWLLVLFAVALFAGFSALAQRCEAWSRSPPAQAHLIVPHHDPTLDPRDIVVAPPTM